MNRGPDVVLEVADLSISFGGVQALRNVSFRLGAGKIIGVMGPNGAGKTTLFNLITGVYRPSTGVVRFGNRELQRLSASSICHVGVARTFQSGRPFGNLTALENVLVGLYFGGGYRKISEAEAKRKANEILELVGLAAHADRPVLSLNLMQKKTVELARALATRPRVLLLDELLAGLNPLDLAPAIDVIVRVKDQLGITVFWIEHIMRILMETCEYLLVLHHGEKLTEGTPSQVVANSMVAEAYFGRKEGTTGG